MNPQRTRPYRQTQLWKSHERLGAKHRADAINWTKYQHVQRIAVNSGAAVFEHFVIAELDDSDEGLKNVDEHGLYDHVMDWFATILFLGGPP